jgi:glycosyltransferase involved in cell wall biosynthesis
LVYINGPRCLPAGVLAARLTGRPSIFHLHRTLTRRSELLIATRTASLATRIVACSQASADALGSVEPKLSRTMQVVYSPAPLVPPQEWRHGQLAARELPRSSGPIVGLVARFTPGKGLHVLIEAAARLRARWPRIQIEMVGAPDPQNPGDAAYVRKLESRVEELGLAGNVRWAGYHSDPGPYFARFDVLALPSVDNGDGVPMVALEAAQWGIPVVAARAGGIPEAVRDGVNGLLVPTGDEKALSTALECVLADSELRARLAAGARTSLDQRFSAVTFRTAIRDIVCNLLSAGRGAARDEEIEARV